MGWTKVVQKYRGKKSHLTATTALGGRMPREWLIGAMGGMLLVAAPNMAHAFNIYDGVTGGNNLEVNLDTTLSYQNFYRVNDPSAVLAGPTNANGNDGDSNFRHGFVSNEFEILPILDIKDGNFGAHFSGDAYLNTSYLGPNQNNELGTFNPFSVSRNTDFTSATRNAEGLNAQLLDAFVYGSKRFGTNDSQMVTLKVGRQTLLWGQSLYFSGNGIAAGQAPINILTAQNLPNAQVQQIVEPVGQAVFTYQPNLIVTLQGYYQFEWQPDYFQASGAYFSTADFLDKGGQRLIAGPGAYFYRTKDRRPPSQNGQFGASLQLTLGNYDVGFYALRYDSKSPTLYLAPGAPAVTPSGLSVGDYNLVYPRDIQVYGASLSTTVGPVNVAGELSGRRNMNLVTGGNISTAANPGGANNDPLYPVGDTMAVQASALYVSPGIPLDPGGVSVSGEIAGNHVLSVAANKAALTPHRSSTAGELEVVASPTYLNVLPNLQLSFPIGLTWDFYGRSEVDPTENHGTGALSLGVTATYRVTWIASLTYNDYLGAPNPNLLGEPSLADRGYLSLNLQHSF